MTGPAGETGAARFASLRPLRHRAFALVWSAALVSNVGTWMQTIAVGTLVTELTGKASGAGFIAAASFVPLGFLAPVGGALADRVDRRRFLLVGNIAMAGVATALAAAYATGHASVPVVAVLVFTEGCLSALTFPCYQAMLPDLVGADDLLAAVSLSSAQFNLGRVIGPALAGIVIHLGSYTWAFATNAASFFAVVAALAVVTVQSPRSGGGVSIWARIVEGARAARNDEGAWLALRLAFVLALFASPFIALIPAVAVVLFHGDAGTTSILVTAQGVGAVTGALSIAPLAERFGRGRVIVANLFLVPVALVLYASAPTIATAAAALAVVGATYINVFSGMNVVIQLRMPPELRGRVLSLYFVVVGIVYPFGAWLQGKIADHAGLRLTTGGAALAMLAAVTAVAVLRPARLRTLDEAAPALA